jgi:4-alpha-glucanotransferase
MRVLQFALDGPANPHWPHNFVPNCVCYTGTHDNDTVNGWFATLDDHSRHYLARTLGKPITNPAWDLIALGWSSVAVLAIAPLQDVLSLGSEARMNRPGVANGNWQWRVRYDQFQHDMITRLAELTTLYNRVPHSGT